MPAFVLYWVHNLNPMKIPPAILTGLLLLLLNFTGTAQPNTAKISEQPALCADSLIKADTCQQGPLCANSARAGGNQATAGGSLAPADGKAATGKNVKKRSLWKWLDSSTASASRLFCSGGSLKAAGVF